MLCAENAARNQFYAGSAKRKVVIAAAN